MPHATSRRGGRKTGAPMQEAARWNPYVAAFPRRGPRLRRALLADDEHDPAGRRLDAPPPSACPTPPRALTRADAAGWRRKLGPCRRAALRQGPGPWCPTALATCPARSRRIRHGGETRAFPKVGSSPRASVAQPRTALHGHPLSNPVAAPCRDRRHVASRPAAVRPFGRPRAQPFKRLGHHHRQHWALRLRVRNRLRPRAEPPPSALAQDSQAPSPPTACWASPCGPGACIRATRPVHPPGMQEGRGIVPRPACPGSSRHADGFAGHSRPSNR